MHFSIDRTVHTMAFDKPVVDHWLERKIAPEREREIERERNVLFNDTLNTFYLRLYGFRHMVKDNCNSEK